MLNSHFIGVSIGTILALSSAVNGATILQYNEGLFPLGTAVTFGQSFTTPNGGPWDNITYAFRRTPATSGAFGTAFLLTTAYSGTPAALSSAASGFLASGGNTASGIYTFPSSLVLQPETTYYLYANALFDSNTMLGGSSAGVTLYVAGRLVDNFVPTNGELNFILTGTPRAGSPTSTVPEPASVGLVLLGLGGLIVRHCPKATSHNGLHPN